MAATLSSRIGTSRGPDAMNTRLSGSGLDDGACEHWPAADSGLTPWLTVAHDESLAALRRFVDTWSLRVEEHAGNPSAVWHDGGPLADASLPPGSAAELATLSVTENPAFSKAIRVCAHLVGEAWRLRDEVLSACVPVLLIAGDTPGTAEPSDAHLALAVSQLLPRLQHVLDVAHQVGATALNTGHQLAAVYGDASRAHAPLQGVRLKSLFTALGACLALLATLDAACDANPGLAAGLGALRRALASQQPPAADAQALDGALRALETRASQKVSFLADWYAAACSGGNFVEGMPDDAQPLPCVRRFMEHLSSVAAEQLDMCASRVAAQAERPGDRSAIAGALCLTVLHARLASGHVAHDGSLLRVAGETHLRVTSLPMACHVALRPAEMLVRHLPLPVLRSYCPTLRDDAAAHRTAAVAALDSGALERTSAALHCAALAWAARCEGAMAPEPSSTPLEALGPIAAASRLRIVIQALHCATRARHALLGALHAHWGASVPVTTSRVRVLMQLAQLLVAMQDSALVRTAGASALLGPHASRAAASRLAAALVSASADGLQPERPAWSGRAHGAYLDAKAALGLAQKCLLMGPLTRERRALVACCVDVLSDDERLGLSPAVASELADLTELVHGAAEWRAGLAECCDTSFLFFSAGELLPAVLTDVVSHPQEAGRLPLTLAAFGAGLSLLRAAGAPYSMRRAYERTLRSAVDRHVIEPLTTACEEDLRLRLLAARLEGAVTSAPGQMPPGGQPAVGNITALLNLPPLPTPHTPGSHDGKRRVRPLHLRAVVAAKLAASFHAHAGLAPHDWRAYTEMRQLAVQAHGLRLPRLRLPPASLDHGLDLLEIVRQLTAFAPRFAYALHANCFVERPAFAAQRRQLHVLGLRHVTHSVRTHGVGVANTAVNGVYTFLTAKWATVSQFLCDDAIRGRLLRERRAVEDAHAAWRTNGGSPPEYSAARAAALQADIARLGTAQGGGTFLDAFRGVIVHMGCALGLVRLIRRAVRRHMTDGAACLPTPPPGHRLAQAAQARGCAPETAFAATALDGVLGPLMSSDRGGADYFTALVTVFVGQLRGPDHQHLQDLWLLLPALCVSHCDALLAAKEKLNARGRDATHAGFTDDGFALGCAYLLRVLDQDAAFDSLRWHAAAVRHYTQMQKEAAQPSERPTRASSAAALAEQEDAQAAADLRQLRATALLTEAKLLHYTLQGARTFLN